LKLNNYKQDTIKNATDKLIQDTTFSKNLNLADQNHTIIKLEGQKCN